MKRTKHSLSHYKLLTTDMGYLTPVGCFSVLPGDSIQQATSLLIRVNPLQAPVMHPVTVRVHHWFVPYRLVWPRESSAVGGWEQFITGGDDGEGDGAVMPQITVTPAVSSLADYMGLPIGTAVTVNAMPFRAYALIWNEFYRDEQLQTPLVIDYTGGTDTTTSMALQRVNWEKDYLTTTRVDPQLGPEVTLPLGTTANVISKGSGTPPSMSDGTMTAANFRSAAGSGATSFDQGGGNVDAWWSETGMLADLSTATAVDVNQVRLAFALQRYQEARNMYGSRYTEYLRYLGIRPSDARLQRPEYLGGGKQTIAFTEVLQTGVTTDASTAGVGNLKGHGIAALRSRRYRRFFEEHGVVISLLSVRPKAMYTDALHMEWSKSAKEDYYQRELEHIGMQEVLKREVRVADGGAVLGWQHRYGEYRSLPSTVSGEFRDSTMNFWHLSRSFGSTVSLNSAFITCEPDTRIYQASLSNNNLWIMANQSIQARRIVGRGNMPGRII